MTSLHIWHIYYIFNIPIQKEEKKIPPQFSYLHPCDDYSNMIIFDEEINFMTQ